LIASSTSSNRPGWFGGNEHSFDSTQVAVNVDRDKILPWFFVHAVSKHLSVLFPESGTNHEKVLPSGPALILLDVDPLADVEAELSAKESRVDWISERGRPDRTESYGNCRRRADMRVNMTVGTRS
jgi:hypothetical protein